MEFFTSIILALLAGGFFSNWLNIRRRQADYLISKAEKASFNIYKCESIIQSLIDTYDLIQHSGMEAKEVKKSFENDWNIGERLHESKTFIKFYFPDIETDFVKLENLIHDFALMARGPIEAYAYGQSFDYGVKSELEEKVEKIISQRDVVQNKLAEYAIKYRPLGFEGWLLNKFKEHKKP